MPFAGEFDFFNANHSIPVGELAVGIGMAVIDNAHCSVGALHDAVMARRRNAFFQVGGQEWIVVALFPWTKWVCGF